MNLKIVFRIGAVINAINGLGLLFITQVFMEQAGFEIAPPLLTIGQGMGVTFIFLAIICWRIPDISGSSLKSFGQLFVIGHILFLLIIGYHIMTGQAGGPPAYGNVVITAILAILYFVNSRETKEISH